MIIILKRNANKEKVENLKTELVNQGFKLHLSEGTEASLIGLIGDTSRIHEDWLKANDVVRMSAGSVSRIRRQTAPCTRTTQSSMSAAERSAAAAFRSSQAPAPSRQRNRSQRLLRT